MTQPSQITDQVAGRVSAPSSVSGSPSATTAADDNKAMVIETQDEGAFVETPVTAAVDSDQATQFETPQSSLPSPAAMETGKATSATAIAPPQHSARRALQIPKSLDDYDLLEELGQGGMGIVYKARQRSMNRIVALKVIRPDRLASMSSSSRNKAVERFRIEAEAASRVNHPSLVTVYSVGFDAGCHYYSMRYVAGTSLAEIVRENPAENRQAAEWMEPVCRAVHAVHECGVLHRDLKPHNVMRDTETGQTLVADFGLAKLSDADEGVTRTGEALGTPAYMSPEQLRDASRVTAVADVYSLGATLYHLLSGRPPFKAATSLQTMRQVLDTEAVPLRRLNPAVDRDLETICMKCLEKEPVRRFPTAAELANELQRYREGRPILARPISVPQRVWRWGRRNRLPAAMIALATFAIVFGVSALGVSQVRTEAARKRSEESFQEAMSAVNDFFTRVSEERLLNEPGLQDVRRDLLQRARTYYERFLKRRESDPTVSEELAATHYRLGLIIEELEAPDVALDWYRRARDMRQQQLLAKPQDAELRRHLSNIINAMGRAASRLGQLDQATKHFREAEQIREQLLSEAPEGDAKVELTRLHANCRMNLGLLERQQAQGQLARELFDRAQGARRAVLAKKPKDRPLRRDLAKGEYNLANEALDRSDADGMKRHLAEAIAILEALVQENPRDLEDQYLLSVCYRMRADLFAALLDREPDAAARAADDYAHAMRIVQKLSDLNPSVTKYLRELAGLAANLGQLAAQRNQTDEALSHFRLADKLLRALIEQAESTPLPVDVELRKTVLAAMQKLQP